MYMYIACRHNIRMQCIYNARVYMYVCSYVPFDVWGLSMVASGLSVCVTLRGHKKLGDHTHSKGDSVVTYVRTCETYNLT